MAIKFEKLKVGTRYYDRRRTRMGNTTMTRMSEWPVVLESIDAVSRSAMVRWNYNTPEKWDEYRLRKLYSWSMNDRERVAK